MKKGVYKAVRKDGTLYYRASFTYKNKHISLGSFDDEESAHRAYLEAGYIVAREPGEIVHQAHREAGSMGDGARSFSDGTGMAPAIEDYDKNSVLSFDKWVVLINFRDNDMYLKTPIYLKERFFYYYFAPEDYLIFDSDDLFYYSTHSIMRRGGHYFVADFGMQVNIRSRYGIKNFAVEGRDYLFANGDKNDYRSANLIVINRYHGVRKTEQGAKVFYEVKIHVNGDLLVGRYDDENTAAVAYNKAADILNNNGIVKDFPENYIEELDSMQYKLLYDTVKISDRIINLRKH